MIYDKYPFVMIYNFMTYSSLNSTMTSDSNLKMVRKDQDFLHGKRVETVIKILKKCLFYFDVV